MSNEIVVGLDDSLDHQRAARRAAGFKPDQAITALAISSSFAISAR